jgi:hypothetical protein
MLFFLAQSPDSLMYFFYIGTILNTPSLYKSGCCISQAFANSTFRFLIVKCAKVGQMQMEHKDLSAE